MPNIENTTPGADFLKSLGFPTLDVHESFTHFDFTTPGRRVLVIGPMGSGKTEFAARIWRDAAVARKKSEKVRAMTSTGDLDRRKIFFIRSARLAYSRMSAAKSSSPSVAARNISA